MAEQFIVANTRPTWPPRWARCGAGHGRHDRPARRAHLLPLRGGPYASRLTDLLDSLLGASEQWPANERLELDDSGGLPRVAASIKPSALAPDFAPLTAEAGIDSERRRLLPILTAAARRGAQVWFDMERYDTKGPDPRLFRDLLAEPELERLHAGIVVQAYLKDSAQDLAQLIEWATAAHRGSRSRSGSSRVPTGTPRRSSPRRPAGARRSTSTRRRPTSTTSTAPACCTARTALSGPALPRTTSARFAYAIAAGRQAGIRTTATRFQLLHGMAEPVHEAIRQLGFRLRVYADGRAGPGDAYLVRRLLENTSQETSCGTALRKARISNKLLAKPKLPRSARGGPVARVRRRTPAPAAASLESAPGGAPSDIGPLPARVPAGAPGGVVPPRVRQQMAEAVGRQAGVLDFFVRRESRPGRADLQDHHLGQPGRSRSTLAIRPAPVSPKPTKRYGSVPPASTSGRGGRPPPARQSVRGGGVDAGEPLRHCGSGGVRGRQVLGRRRRDVCEAIDYLEYYGRQAIVLGRGGTVQSRPARRTASATGAGRAVVIAPWNFPSPSRPGWWPAPSSPATRSCSSRPSRRLPSRPAGEGSRAQLRTAGAPGGRLCLPTGIGEEIGDHLVTHRDVTTVAFPVPRRSVCT